MALNANALTSVQKLKLQLEIGVSDTSQDPLLELYINAASEQIAKFCNRVFEQRNITEVVDGTGRNELIFNGRPVTAITSVHVDSSRIFGADSLLDSSEYAAIDGYILRKHSGVWVRGSQVIKLSYTCGFLVIPSDLDMGCMLIAEYLFRRKNDRRSGKVSISKGSESVSYADDWPTVAINLIKPYVIEPIPGMAVK